MNRFHLRWPVPARTSALLLALVMFCSVAALAQSTSSGTITGTVTDPQGAVIPDVTITVTDAVSKTKRTTLANGTGEYVLPDVPPGTYNITASKAGFSTDEISGLEVSVATQTTANFKMSIGAESTTVEVTASNADLQTMNASTGTTVDPAQVENLPTIGREVSTFMTMQPGVTPGGNVAGTTVDQATFTLDGGSNSSDMDGTANVYTTSYATSTTGGFIGAGPQGTMPMPQDSVEEFKVTTTGQTAEFNNSSGSQSQVVTRRGHAGGTVAVMSTISTTASTPTPGRTTSRTRASRQRQPHPWCLLVPPATPQNRAIISAASAPQPAAPLPPTSWAARHICFSTTKASAIPWLPPTSAPFPPTSICNLDS